ncbi:MAG TPA: enoyl-CoA hydratase/isomerase family protein [Xanthobacteraceae bacterium]|jgi:thioesterase DpgC|nr:enoyl-CoA hydratase/isomerase family protein [Xanthobacteraceae bacterium]
MSDLVTRDAAVGANLRSAGLDEHAIAEWAAAMPRRTGDFYVDQPRYERFWQLSGNLLARLPRKPTRSPAEAAAAAAILAAAREQREHFLAAHCQELYDELTRQRSRFVRLEDLVFAAAEAVPGLTPTAAQLAAQADLLQSEKDGIEIDQGIFLAHVLACEEAGRHLCHAMLLPRPETADYLKKFAGADSIDLGKVTVTRRGKAAVVTATNARFLNAEDNTTLDAMEIAVDLAILDPNTDIAVLRGGEVEHPKYRGRRLFGAGINLTHLYRGQIPFVWFLKRDLGFVHKFYRGVARPELLPDDVHGTANEKPWIAAVDGFAIGGHCQILLTMDYVLAAGDAFMTLPARKEGIIPGAANLRLPRFTGDRIARQAIQYERKLVCDSPEGRLICDEIAAPDDMDGALDRVIAGLTSSGAVSATSNRRALRIGQEPLDIFRQYFSAYARDQAYCHYSPALIANLEREWDAHNRKV